jgi:hypothetical protein
MRMSGVRAAAVVALAGVVAGCSSGPPAVSADGPLAGAAPGGSDCGPARPGAGFTFGIETFQNVGHTTLVLDSVALRDPRGLRLIGAYADPNSQRSWLVGAVPGWPPESFPGFPNPPTWKDRQPVPGFRVAPGEWFNMVIGVEAPRRPGGSTSGLIISYHDSAGRYVVEDHFAYILVTLPACKTP